MTNFKILYSYFHSNALHKKCFNWAIELVSNWNKLKFHDKIYLMYHGIYHIYVIVKIWDFLSASRVKHTHFGWFFFHYLYTSKVNEISLKLDFEVRKVLIFCGCVPNCDKRFEIYIYTCKIFQTCFVTCWEMLLWSDLIWFLVFNATFSYIMVTSFSGGRSRSTRREPPTMGKQLVNFITCDCESSAPFFVMYKDGCKPSPYWW